MELKKIKNLGIFFIIILLMLTMFVALISILHRISIKAFALTNEGIESTQEENKRAKSSVVDNSTITSDTTIEAGTTVNNLTVAGGTLYVEGTVNNLTVNKGTVYIQSNGMVSGSLTVSGKGAKPTLYVKSGGAVTGAFTIEDADVTLESGATACDIRVTLQLLTINLNIQSGASVQDITLIANERGSNLRLDIAGTVKNLSGDGGRITLQESAIISENVTLLGGANVMMHSGSTVGRDVLMTSGGRQSATIELQINASIGGDLTLNNQGWSPNATIAGHIYGNLIANDGIVNIEASGIVSGEITAEGGTLTVAGFVASDIILNTTNASCILQVNGVIGGTIYSNGSLVNIESGADIQNVEVTSNNLIGKVNVKGNATVQNVKVTVRGGSMGELTVESGGNVQTLRMEGGKVNVQSNATVGNATVFGYEGYLGELTIQSGGKVDTLKLEGGSVEAAGSIDRLTANNGDIQLLESGSINDFTVSGTVDLRTGANTVGGTASNIAIEKNGILRLWGDIKTISITGTGSLELMSDTIFTVVAGTNIQNLSGNGTVNIKSGGSVTVPSGKNFSGSIENFGLLNIAGTITKVTKNTLKATVINAGILNVEGSIDSISNTTNGVLNVNSGAKVAEIESEGKTVVNVGASVSNLTLNGGITQVKNGAIVNSATLNDDKAVLETDSKDIIQNLVQNSGTIIDNSIKVNKNNSATIIIILAVAGGIVVFSILIFLIVYIILKKKKKEYNSIVYQQMREKFAEKRYFIENNMKLYRQNGASSKRIDKLIK